MGLNEIYKKVLIDVYTKGIETQPRNMKTRELLSYRVILADPNDNIITLPGFKTNVEYAQLEFEWYLANTNRIDWHPTIEKIWKKYSGDGIHVNSAYGYRIFGGHKECPNQWEYVKKTLLEDSDSRRATIMINMPNDRLYNEVNKADCPCTYSLNFRIFDKKLTLIVNMRSNDVYFGFRNDIYCFTELQKKMAKELKLGLGQYIHNADSMHIYEKQYKKVDELILK